MVLILANDLGEKKSAPVGAFFENSEASRPTFATRRVRLLLYDEGKRVTGLALRDGFNKKQPTQ